MSYTRTLCMLWDISSKYMYLLFRCILCEYRIYTDSGIFANEISLLTIFSTTMPLKREHVSPRTIRP